MDEKDWSMLIAIAEERNITKAAERLYLSQPAVTYRLRMLEGQFRTKLVYRTPSGALLTPEGEILLKYAKDMQQQLMQTKEKLLSLGTKVQGPLRIGSSAIFANYVLPQVLNGFLEMYPDVEIFLKTGQSRQAVRMLEKDEVSFAIVRGDYPWNEEIHLLCEEPICLASSRPLTLEELPERPRIVYGTDSSLQEMVDEWWRQTFSRPPLTHMAVDTMDTCRRMVVHNLGWAALPSIGLKEHDGLFILPLHWKNGEPLLRRTWGLCRSMSLEFSTVRAFLAYLTEESTRYSSNQVGR